MITNIHHHKILFIDIETVPQYEDFSTAPQTYQKLWLKKAAQIAKNDEDHQVIYHKAGIYAEFGKIICISTGFIFEQDHAQKVKIQSFFHKDEKQLLNEFLLHLESFQKNKEVLLCAHNGKEFDFPYIARRILINELKLPEILNVAGFKPWETKFIDTMELWKFGDRKNYTSLETLAYIFNIPTPKDDIDGSMVADIYYKEKNIQRIVTYCRKDVLTIIQLLLKYSGMPLLSANNVIVQKI